MKIYIKEFLKQNGYDVNDISEGDWEDIEDEWEEECEQYCYNAIHESKEAILLEWSYRAKVKKKS